MSKLLRIGISHGDINGIGYEILLKTFSDERMMELCTPVIYGSSKVISYYRKALNTPPIPINIISSANEINEGQINLVNCVVEDVKIDMGTATPTSGAAAFKALDTACDDLKNHIIDALVTLPINKDAIQSENFNFPGHTEFLESRFAENDDKALMILATDTLRVALVTTHLPINEVSTNITQDKILEKLRLLQQTLRRDFKVEVPRIAVLGLNPHAGENGLLGSEENEIIAPAIKLAQDENIMCAGPFASDGFFGTSRYKDFDAVLAMYHDQGLIPFKSIAMDYGVNFTAGLQIVRTSPDHGTGYDIAGKNEASEESFRQAIYMAVDIYKNRKNWDEARKNPLKKMFYDRGRDDEKLDLTKDEN